MRKRLLFPILPALAAAIAPGAMAHCPLCTMGAAVAAGGAMYLGVSKAAIGVFIGAFAVSTGWWLGRKLKERIPYQLPLIVIASLLLTVIPMLPMLGGEYYPVYVSLAGGYGSLLNRTYLIDLFLAGSLIGAAIVALSPWLSRKIADARSGKMVPFQGLILTFVLLLASAGIMQLVARLARM